MRPANTRTEGRLPVWGSEFTTKAATQQGDSAGFLPSFCVVGLGPVATRARVLVHEVFLAKEFAERRLRVAAYITPGLRSKNNARGMHLPPEVSWLSRLMRPNCASLSPQYSPPQHSTPSPPTPNPPTPSPPDAQPPDAYPADLGGNFPQISTAFLMPNPTPLSPTAGAFPLPT